MREDAEEFRRRDAQVVAVAPHSVADTAKYVGRNGPFPYLILADDSHGVFDAYDVQSRMLSLGQRPALFVVDRDGTVRFDSVGEQQWQIPTDEEVLAVLDSL